MYIQKNKSVEIVQKFYYFLSHLTKHLVANCCDHLVSLVHHQYFFFNFSSLTTLLFDKYYQRCSFHKARFLAAMETKKKRKLKQNSPKLKCLKLTFWYVVLSKGSIFIKIVKLIALGSKLSSHKESKGFSLEILKGNFQNLWNQKPQSGDVCMQYCLVDFSRVFRLCSLDQNWSHLLRSHVFHRIVSENSFNWQLVFTI